MTRARVSLIATGGTIDHLGADRLDLAFYAGPHLGPGKLLARVPEVDRIADVRLMEAPQLRGPYIGWPELVALSRAVVEATHDADGVVVTRGTNTLEETAYFLDLTVAGDAPVVLTGAMRPASAMSADGDLNLVNAVRVAASADARGIGAVVVMSDEIWSARDVVKTATHRTHAFQARGAGPLGEITPDGAVHVARTRTSGRLTLPLPEAALPRVDVVLSYVGADGALIDAAVAAGARGIVHAGAGTGRGSASEDAALDRAIARGVVVCQATRAATGRVLRSDAMRARGVIAASDLAPWKARVLLALALTSTSDADRIQDLFDRA